MNAIQETAEEILSQYFSTPVQLHLIKHLPSSERTTIFRFSTVTDSASIPKTVIVKQSSRPYGAMIEGIIDGNVWQDWASLQFLNGILPQGQVVPAYYGGDQTSRFFIIQDMGADSQDLREILLYGDLEQGRQGLLHFFTNLGKLHAHTRGYEALFLQTRRSLGTYDPAEEFYKNQQAHIHQRFQSILNQLHISPSPDAMADLNRVFALLAHPKAFYSYIHGDANPFNCLVAQGTSYLIDFEYGTYAHALLDGAQARMLFPSCGFVNHIPSSILQEVEAAYREALIQGCPEASDDALFSQALTAACAYWAINFCVWRSFVQIMAEDCAWGTTTVRHLYILRAEQFAQTTKETGYFQALGATFTEIASHLRLLWPEATNSLPLYPAFRTSTH